MFVYRPVKKVHSAPLKKPIEPVVILYFGNKMWLFFFFFRVESLFYFVAWLVFTVSIVLSPLLLLVTHTCASPNFIHTFTKPDLTALHAKMNRMFYFAGKNKCQKILPSILILMSPHLFIGPENSTSKEIQYTRFHK